MKTIAAALTTAQRRPHGRGVATATLADDAALHTTQLHTWAPGAIDNVVACNCGAYYVRIRQNAGALDYQKITDPTVAAQWTTWSNLVASNVAAARSIAIFYCITFVVIAWQDLATGAIRYRRSADAVTWGADTLAYAGVAFTKIFSGCSATATTGGIAAAFDAQLYWLAYNAATDTWAAQESAGLVFTTTEPDVAVFYDTIVNRYIFALSVAGYQTWSSHALIIVTRTLAGAWDTGLMFAQEQINGLWWLSFYKITGWVVVNVSNQLVCSSNDGVFWSDPYPTQLPGAERTMTILRATSAWPNPYISGLSSAWQIALPTVYWPATVLRYRFEAAIAGSQASGGGNESRPQMIAVLDNRAGQLTTPQLFTVFTLDRGLRDLGVTSTQPSGTWYLVGYRYIEGDELLELQCVDARGLLATWFAADAVAYRGHTVKALVEQIAALAGVHTCTFDSFAAWTDTVPAFALPAGENALFGLRSLARRVPFEYIVKEDGSLYFYVPTASPASVYTFGYAASEHKFWPGEFGGEQAVNYIQVIGTPPRTMVTVSYGHTDLDLTGRRRSLIVNERSIVLSVDSTELSNALMVVVKEGKRAGEITIPPCFSIEPGDVVSFNDNLYSETAGRWRIERIAETFNYDGTAWPFYQTITLRGVVT